MVDRYRPSQIKKMKAEAKETRSPVLYSQIANYYSSDRRTYKQCEKYAMKALKCGGDPTSAYQIGYIYEKRSKCVSDYNISQAYENKMRKYYAIAANAGHHGALTRLGVFYIKKRLLFNGKTPLQLLETAAYQNYLPAIHNLTYYHPDLNTKFEWAYKRYELTQRVKDIERLIRMVNHYRRHRDYLKIGEKVGIDYLDVVFHGANIRHTKIIIDSCGSCDRRSKCIPLQCKHLLCHQCIFKLSVCPQCTNVI